MPNEFVLKCNHNSGGGMCICRDKTKIDVDEIKKILEKNLRINYFWHGREWAYKDIEPRIIAEKFMKDDNSDKIMNSLVDYKFYCFDGEPKFLYVGVDDISKGTKGELRLSILDMDWKPAPFYRNDHKQMPVKIDRPDCLKEMIDICRRLSKDIPFVRVDLYYINGNIFFSELTLYPGGGFGLFSPAEWERTLGDWIRLPE